MNKAVLRACALALLSPAVAAAEEACGLCNTEVVTNSGLAECFLQDYEALASGDGPVVVVDLSQCETSRALAQALPSPVPRVGAPAEPDIQFMVSRAQLACLKRKLEEPGLVLDPSARIDLNSCG
jgi:hypothetical protein